MDMSTQDQMLDEFVFQTEKGMNPTILPPAMSK